MSSGTGRGKAKATIGVIRGPRAEPMDRLVNVLANGPILAPDAIVVLCGEDHEPRMQTAIGHYVQVSDFARRNKVAWRPTVLLTGGGDDLPRIMGAETMHRKTIAGGVSPEHILTDDQAANTREQAVNAVREATERNWRRILVVASAYHMPRAFLTFVRALNEAGQGETIQVMPAPVNHTPWFGCPEGMDTSRVDLLDGEYRKIREYAEHVATPEEGLAYLEYWETHEPEAVK